MATSEPGKFCQMAASLLPKDMHIKDEPLTIREELWGRLGDEIDQAAW
jgi:hypothetical protein